MQCRSYPFMFAALIATIFTGAGCNGAPSINKEHFSKSIGYHNQASTVLNSGTSDSMQASKVEQMVVIYQKALAEGRQVDIQKLNEAHAGFGDHYRDSFIAGLNAFIEGYRTEDDQKFLHGQVLLDEWGTWYDQNIDQNAYEKI